MTPARDPKQLFLRATRMRNHEGDIMQGDIMEDASGGGFMDEESWRRHHGGGIREASWTRHLEEASWRRPGDIWRRHHGGGIMEEASGRRHQGEGIMEEASWRRHHGGVTNAPGFGQALRDHLAEII